MTRPPTHPWRAWHGREDSARGAHAKASKQKRPEANPGAERRPGEPHLPVYHYTPGSKL